MTAFWIVFAAISEGHLTACFLEWEPVRKVSKVVLVPLLILGLLLAKVYQPLLFLGLVLGWLGDIFLLFDRKTPCFIAGAIFFVLGHFSYITATLRLFFEENSGGIPPLLWVLFALVALVLFTTAGVKVSRHIGAMAYLGAGYFTVLACALLLSAATHRYVLALAFALFLVSDTTLSVCRFARQVKREHFYVMLTYILAQTLICISFMFSV